MPTQFSIKHILLTLIIFLVIIIGGIIGWSAQSKINIQLEHYNQSNVRNIEKEITFSLQDKEQKAATLLSILSKYQDLYKVESLQEIPILLPILTQTLEQMPNLVTIYTGDSDGNLLAVMKLKTTIDYQAYSDYDGAPQESSYAVRLIQNHNSTFIYFDEDLNPIGTATPPKTTHYDPRIRPWFKSALESHQIVKTPVYTFYTTKKKGYTLVQQVVYTTNEDISKTTVFAVDVRLDYLDKQVEMLRPSPNSRISLVDNVGNHISGDPITTDAYLHAKGHLEDSHFYYSVSKISTLSDNLSYNLVLSISKSDLFSESQDLYRTQILISLFCILFGIIMGLLFSERIASDIALLSKKINAVKVFDFKHRVFRSYISDTQKLSDDIDAVSDTINAFKTLTFDITKSHETEQMLALTLQHLLFFTQTSSVVLYKKEEDNWTHLKAATQQNDLADDELAFLTSISERLLNKKKLQLDITYTKNIDLEFFSEDEFNRLNQYGHQACIVPLLDRRLGLHGALVFIDQHPFTPHKKRFIKDLSTYLGLSLENKDNIDKQRALFDAFIHIIANAIDTKNPATANHCSRVPNFAIKLAQATCNKRHGRYANFNLNANEWEALYIAAWLHDCGKITTPEYVIDKATKLETVHNRIHEIRMRFEILKQEAELKYWKNATTNRETDYTKLQKQLEKISEDYYFIARCNLPDRELDDKDIERINNIATQTWTATLDDSIGLSLPELKRRINQGGAFPRKEQLLADKAEHKIERNYLTQYPEELDIKMPIPTYLYDRGELTNIKIKHGTLTQEERFKTNEHIIQTLIMLKSLPFPKHLSHISDWAASHRERMDGDGYPRNLTKDEIHPVARMIAIADIYQALTQTDKAYKRKKSHQEAIEIMQQMSKEGHIDPDLFEIFIQDCHI